MDPEPQVPQGAVGVGAAELDRNKDSPEHIYQVIIIFIYYYCRVQSDLIPMSRNGSIKYLTWT